MLKRYCILNVCLKDLTKEKMCAIFFISNRCSGNKPVEHTSYVSRRPAFLYVTVAANSVTAVTYGTLQTSDPDPYQSI